MALPGGDDLCFWNDAPGGGGEEHVASSVKYPYKRNETIVF